MRKTIEIDIKKIKPYAANPRLNTESIKACSESIREFGFTSPIIIDSCNVIICGHTRYYSAIANGMEKVPCVIIDDLDNEKIRALRIADNKISEMSKWDNSILKLELDQLKNISLSFFSPDDIDKLYNVKKEKEQEKKEDIIEIKNDAIFSGCGKYDLPKLRDDMISDIIPDVIYNKRSGLNYSDYYHPLYVFGSDALPKISGLIVCFYVDDYRFDRVWLNPKKYADIFKKNNIDCIITPDFSTYVDDPLAVQIYNVYKSRWLSRYFQESGINIIPSISYSDDRSYEYILSGIPEQAKVLSVQCRTLKTHDDKTRFKKGLKYLCDNHNFKTLIVYGGKQHQELLVDLNRNTVVLDSFTTMTKKE